MRLAQHYFPLERFIRLEGLDEVPLEVLRAIIHAMGLSSVPLRIELGECSALALE